jgi:hypothetical protein
LPAQAKAYNKEPWRKEENRGGRESSRTGGKHRKHKDETEREGKRIEEKRREGST